MDDGEPGVSETGDRDHALHVWAWEPNPHGMFVDWNPKVSCEHHTASH